MLTGKQSAACSRQDSLALDPFAIDNGLVDNCADVRGVTMDVQGKAMDVQDDETEVRHDLSRGDRQDDEQSGDEGFHEMQDNLEGAPSKASEGPVPNHSWLLREPLSLDAARLALADLTRMLKPPRACVGGFLECQLPLQLRTRLEWMSSFLHTYTDTCSPYG